MKLDLGQGGGGEEERNWTVCAKDLLNMVFFFFLMLTGIKLSNNQRLHKSKHCC